MSELDSQDIVSIIIPVYNVEKYLIRCLDSVINQSYKNIEIILIDDGSTDASGSICDDFVRRDTRIKAIHKENTGSADSRNKGMKIAKGNYIGFVDSDDWISTDMYEVMINTIKKYKADVVVCNYNEIAGVDKHNITADSTSSIIEFRDKELIEEIILEKRNTGISYAPWRAMFKREIIKGIGFETGRYYEDLLFITKAFMKIKQGVYINKRLYNYVIHNESVTHSEKTMKHIVDIIEQTIIQIGILESELPNKTVDFCKRKFYFLVISLYKEMKKKNHMKEEIKYLKEILKSLKKNKWNLIEKNMKISTKLLIKFSLISPDIYIKLCNMKQVCKLSLKEKGL